MEGILTALAADSRIGMTGPGDWYRVSEAGFNYIDDQCSAYFYSLFRLNRRRESLKSSFGAFGQTTNAILQATGATTVSMTVVAQAFGLASAMTDIVAGTFLFELPPATTREFVSKLQRAYRTGAAQNRGVIDTPTTAYHVIQDYLSLCLPPTIEARLIGHVADAKAVPDPTPGASIGVVVGTGNPAVVEAVLRQPNMPLRGTATTAVKPIRQPPTAPGWEVVNTSGLTIDLSTGRAIQRALCMPAGTIDGIYGRRTSEALKIFASVNAGRLLNPNWQDTTVSLTPKDLNILRKQPACSQDAKNYLERHLVEAGAVADIGKKIAAKYPGAPANGGLPSLRPFIERWRSELGLNSGLAGEFYNQLTPDFLALSKIFS